MHSCCELAISAIILAYASLEQPYSKGRCFVYARCAVLWIPISEAATEVMSDFDIKKLCGLWV